MPIHSFIHAPWMCGQLNPIKPRWRIDSMWLLVDHIDHRNTYLMRASYAGWWTTKTWEAPIKLKSAVTGLPIYNSWVECLLQRDPTGPVCLCWEDTGSHTDLSFPCLVNLLIIINTQRAVFEEWIIYRKWRHIRRKKETHFLALSKLFRWSMAHYLDCQVIGNNIHWPVSWRKE